MKPRWYYTYIMQSSSRRALYTGVCSNLERRVFQHKNGTYEGFTSRHQAWRLVYFERFGDVRTAIDREKQLKGWRRDKKLALIESVNPKWKDLSVGWYQRHRYQPETEEPQDPSTRG
jgi:putative endonuclease